MKRITAMLLMICLCLMGQSVLAEKKVGKIAVAQEPTKMDYWVGEEFSAEGGVLLVTYRDKTTAEIPMTDENVKLPNVKTNTPGRKAVKVTYGGKNVTFYINVAEKGAEVTFELNYDGALEAQKEAARQGKGVEAPEIPVRDGYTFDAWYTDAACTVLYDFAQVVEQPMTLYANWLADDAVYYPVTYSLNYYGVLPDGYVQQVKSGETARMLSLALVRDEFEFIGWYADAACTVPYVQENAIEGETIIYAGWKSLKMGAETYTFEAEQTSLLGKEGPGMSGSASGASMIVNDATNLDASNGKYVSYLYKKGLSLDFYLASSEAVSDAVLTLRVAAEMDNISLSPDNYTIEVNGQPVMFDAIALEKGAKFADCIVIQNVALQVGANTIRLVTNNSVNPMGEGMGTYQGTAPMVDCIKLTTTAVVTWDANYNLPMMY